MLIGLPVKPCTSSTPVRPSAPSAPGKSKGSAPGRTSFEGEANGNSSSGSVPLASVDGRRRAWAADCPSAAAVPSLAVHEGGVLFYWFLKFVAVGPAVTV